MKKIIASIIGVFILFACITPCAAQTDVKLDPEVGARLSVGLDKKIIKGLHITLEEEVRFGTNFTTFDRLQTTLFIKYKLNPYVRFGIGYAFINPYASSTKAFKNCRHRLMADVTGTYTVGNWAMSLKERFQWTYHTGDYNTYQNPRNALTLKSRFTVKYKGFRVATPYAFVEIRNVLNAPVISAYYDGTDYMTAEGYTSDVAGWFLSSYKGAYLNRFRGALGVEIKIKKHHKLDFCFYADYIHDKVVDANSEGTKLKSYTKETGFGSWLCAGYVFDF